MDFGCKKVLENCQTMDNNFTATKDKYDQLKCKYCYKNGDFVLPDLTLEQQTERLTDIAVQKFGTSKDVALQMAQSLLPSLKRWQ